MSIKSRKRILKYCIASAHIEKPEPKNKGWLRGIISIIVLVFAGGIAFALIGGDTDREIENEEVLGVPEGWVAYENETVGYTISHPSDWEVVETEGGIFATIEKGDYKLILAGAVDGSGMFGGVSREDEEILVGGIEAKRINWFTEDGEIFYAYIFIEDFYSPNFSGSSFAIDIDAIASLEIDTQELYDEERGVEYFEGRAVGKVGEEFQMMEKMLETLEWNFSEEDWQTYRNEEYGFELRLSDDWMVLETKEGGLTIKQKSVVDDEHAEHTTFVGIEENPKRLPIEEWFNENVFRTGYYEEEAVTVDGREALKFLIGGIFTREVVFVAKEDLVVVITSMSESSEYFQYFEDSILGLKFID